MSKLPEKYRFLDLSDYGRRPAAWIAHVLKNTKITPIHVTTSFVVAGVIAIAAIIFEQYLVAGVFLILKSVLDAADGELSRVKKQPSYSGRYYDSIADWILNLAFLGVIGWKASQHFGWILLAFVIIQLQGTLYNYYYVILRNRFSGDQTSRIFETEPPQSMPGESQQTVNVLFRIYNTLYIAFDKAIYYTDSKAADGGSLPRWFMTTVSCFGLGFQLLMIAILLNVAGVSFVIPFFVITGLLLPILILVRRLVL